MSGSGINPNIALNAAGTSAIGSQSQNPFQQMTQYAQAANGLRAIQNGQASPLGVFAARPGADAIQQLASVGDMQTLTNGIILPSSYQSPFSGASDTPFGNGSTFGNLSSGST